MSKAKGRRRSGAGTERGTTYGRRFTDSQHQHGLTLVASGLGTSAVAKLIGTSDKSIRNWVKIARATGTMPTVPIAALEVTTPPASDTQSKAQRSKSQAIYAPKDPGQGLSDFEVAAIMELKRAHPSFGPAQIRAQLKRFKGWRVANKAIARVLRTHGYELVHRGARPQGPDPIRFEAPRRNALWQMDFTELRVGSEKFSLLVILDDFSRYVVAHSLCDSQETTVVINTLRLAIARHGKPETVRSDRGGAFTSKAFSQALEAELIDQIVGRPYHPEGGGKVEAVMGTLRRELWDVEHFASRHEASQRLVAFFEDYNERRAHMGIDGLTPADRYFGRADRVLAQIDALSRRRNGANSIAAPAGAPIEEPRAPMEVLRLLIVDGRMELRLCGAVVQLGRVRLK